MTTSDNRFCTLSISCVVYDTEYEILATTIESLKTSLELAIQQKTLTNYTFSLINNQPTIPMFFQRAATLAKNILSGVEIISGHGNIGYGKANNLAIHRTKMDFHLILNPDVKLDPLAISEGIAFLIEHKNVDLVAPNAFDENGKPEYLCKRMPSPLIIFLRGINSKILNHIFKELLDWYTYKNELPASEPLSIELASGCFMLCRTETLKRINGFSPDYFLYFEDFDLSRKMTKKVFLPSMKITHLGGKTATKGLKHIKIFLYSYFVFIKFQRKHKNT